MIGILDYGAGNVQAIARIYNNLKIPNKLITCTSDFEGVEKLILPGVGSFDAVVSKLNKSGFKDRLSELVLVEKTPVLGICVGLQIMAKSSEEGTLSGLGWINATVKKFKLPSEYHVPHMGWNTFSVTGTNDIFKGTDNEFGFYFVHSFYFDLDEEIDSTARTTYGIEFTSAIRKGNIVATQFHPEKSHSNGVTLLKNFAEQEIC
ncbi:imidazole glycerol phosphate synthase subunit HisH [Schleiferiaceae bacterium]|nr:imidazole glycerol phosphate synthase subunit HisH [Schleiferiaceae bacterium]